MDLAFLLPNYIDDDKPLVKEKFMKRKKIEKPMVAIPTCLWSKDYGYSLLKEE